MKLRSLQARSALVTTLLFAAIGLVALAAFLLAARSIVENFGRRFAVQHAVLGRDRILSPIQRELALSRKLADSAVLKAWIRSEGDPTLRALALAELESHRRIFRDGSWFLVHDASRHYYFNDAQGSFTGKELRYRIDPADPTMAWYFAAMAQIEDFALHVDNSEQLDVTKVWVNVLVRDGERKVGLGGTGLDLTGFLKQVVQSGEKGTRTILVDHQGFLQAHPDTELMAANARIKDESKRITLFQLLGGDTDRRELASRLERLSKNPSAVETFYLTEEGKRYLVAATTIPDIGWVSLALVDPQEVVGMRAFRPVLLMLLACFLAALVLGSLFMNRLVLRPLARLTASTRDIAGGHYDIELPVDREDEIGQLTSAFNHMTATVRDHTTHLERKVAERTEALSEVNRKLTESNRKILAGLDVAQLLQSSLLPGAEQRQAMLGDHFLMYRPLDVVGGDFYALFPDPQGCLVAVGDCTGHGVAGALMTMSAQAVLEHVLADHGLADLGLLLGEMNRAMKAVLHQEKRSRQVMDNGLDLALLRVEDSRIRFAGAHLPLLIQRNDATFEEFPGDRQSLGYRRSDPGFVFRETALEVAPGDACYLMTDGILDQGGGIRGFGLGRTRLRQALASLGNAPMAMRGEALSEALASYMGDRNQRDDITVLGFRFQEGA